MSLVRSARARTSDSQIRTVLRSDLNERYAGVDSLILNELPIRFGYAKLDVAVLNGHLHGFEIKSDRDQLTRLDRQVTEFSSVCDRLTIVTTDRHIERVIQHVPSWCGIMLASESSDVVNIEQVREADPNPKWDILSVLFLLWQSETYRLAKKFGYRGRSGRAKWAIHVELARRVSHDILGLEVLKILRARTSWSPRQMGTDSA